MVEAGAGLATRADTIRPPVLRPARPPACAGTADHRGVPLAGTLVVANFNIHAGVDGWARPYDLTVACASLDADVLVLEENFAPDGELSAAARVAASLGYELCEVGLARARLLDEDPALRRPAGPASWAPRFGRREVPRALLLERAARRSGRRRLQPGRGRARRPGSWGLALLHRVPVRSVRVLELRPLVRDPASRRVILADLEAGVVVAGTHLAHLSHGSVLQMRQLSRQLGAIAGPKVLLGDMNSWTLPLLAMLPGWRRAVRGPTWPAAMPHSQIDHVLVSGGVRVISSEVTLPLGSDHRAVRATLGF